MPEIRRTETHRRHTEVELSMSDIQQIVVEWAQRNVSPVVCIEDITTYAEREFSMEVNLIEDLSECGHVAEDEYHAAQMRAAREKEY